MSADNPKFSEKTDPQSWNLYSYVGNNPLARIDPLGQNWFNFSGSWQWFKGSDVDSDGNPCEKGEKGCYHSDYTVILKIEKTGKRTKDGAEIEKLTLLGEGEDDILATGIGYSGQLGKYFTTPNGDYEINLNKRGGPETESLAPDGTLASYPGGIQKLGLFKYNGKTYNASNEWGEYRANLIMLKPGGAPHFYLHGKQLYFDEGRTYTHGCTTEPYQKVLAKIFSLDPSGVGEGAKNGRILVTISGK
jgi:hypothetical protein